MQRTGTRHGGIVLRKEKARGQDFLKASRPPKTWTTGVLLPEQYRVLWVVHPPQ